MVLGTDKFSYHNFVIDGVKVSWFKEVKLLGITIDDPLIFKKHIEDLCNLHGLRRSRP